MTNALCCRAPMCIACREMWRLFARARSSPSSSQASGGTAATSQVRGGGSLFFDASVVKGGMQEHCRAACRAAAIGQPMHTPMLGAVSLRRSACWCLEPVCAPHSKPAAVSHVESFALSPDEMAGVLQRKFQTSCSVSKLPGKDEKDHEIMMQVRTGVGGWWGEWWWWWGGGVGGGWLA